MNHKTTLVRLAMILTVASLLTTLLTVQAVPVWAAGINLSVTSASPGTQITVSGSAFVSGESYQIYFAPGTAYSTQLVPPTPIPGTSFSTPITIPQAPFGQYYIRVIATTSGTLDLLFNVAAGIALNSASGYTGDTLLVSGGGFRSSVTVNVLFNNSIIANSSTSASGVLTPVSFQVPAIRGGNYYVYAADGDATSSPVLFTVKARLRADISQGAVGDQVKLEGTGFDSNSGISINWDSGLATTTAIFSSNTGSFLTNITVPPSTRGNHTIRARDNATGVSTVSFEVISSLTVSPGSASPASTVSLTGRGFSASVSVTVTFNGTAISTQPTTITTNSTGGFSASFVVPSIIQGNYIVRAFDGVYPATATLQIASSITLSPSSGNVGTEVSVSGTGFSPGGKVTLSYDNQTLTTVSADNTGALSTSFVVPASKAGQHSIAARDLTTQAVLATAAFTMESIPPPVPDLLTPENDSMADTLATFRWSVVTDPSGVTYDLQVARDASFSALVLSKEELSQTSYQLGPSEKLELSKKVNPYYWRVRAKDGAGNESDWTSPNSFYTEDSTPPPVSLPLMPENGSQGNGKILFDWSEVSDPSGVTYTLQVARDAAFTRIVVLKEGLDKSEYRLTDTEKLSQSTGDPPNPYYWRVSASDGAQNESAWSNINIFYVGTFFQGWVLYALAAIAGVVLVLAGIVVGMRIRPAKPKA